MNKIVTVILVTLLVVYLFRRMAQKRVQPPAGKQKGAEDMVRCKTCGVNLPRSEALMSQGRFYCCDEHRNSDA